MNDRAAEGDLLGRDPELADLVRTLRTYGALTREELLERSGARDWPDRGFSGALRRGVAEGIIRELNAGLFEIGPDAPDLDEGRFDPT
jgi:hypothetical protein